MLEDIVAIEIASRDDLSRARLEESVATILDVKFDMPDAVMLLLVAGYDADERELWDVPEVCAFVRQMIAMFGALGLRAADFKLHERTQAWLALCHGAATLDVDARTGERRAVFRRLH